MRATPSPSPSPSPSRPLPLREHLAVDTRDLDEVVAAASATQHPLDARLERAGTALRFRLHHEPVGALAVTHVAFDYAGRYSVAGETREDLYFLQLPLEGRGFVWQGRTRFVVAPEACSLLASPGTATQWEGSGGFREITVGIDADRLMRYWSDLTGERGGRPLRFTPAIPLHTPIGVAMRQRVRTLVSASAESRPALEEQLLDVLLQDLPHDHSDVLRHSAPDADERLVRRAEAYLEATAGESVTILQVARAHEVSIRTLQRAFRRRRCTGPRRFLQDLRFSCARTRLLQAEEGDTVTRVAVSAGFSHLGQFSVGYKARYGESPSHTLSRSR